MDKKEIQAILEEEESRYYPWVMEELRKANPNPSEEEKKRIDEEMAILHKVNHSKILYVMKTLVERIKNDGEDYFLGVDIPSLYVVYLLGLSKFSPLETATSYEPYLGDLDGPRKCLRAVIHVRPEYQEKAIGYLEDYQEDANIYVSRHYHEKGLRNDSFAFFPKKLDVRKEGFPFVFAEGKEYPILFHKVGEITMGFEIFVNGRKRLAILYHTKRGKSVGFEEGIVDYATALEDKRFTFPLERKYFGLVKDLLHAPLRTFVSFFSVLCDTHSMPEKERGNRDMIKMLRDGNLRFPERDSLYHYLRRNGVSCKEAQEACMATSGGRLLKEYRDGKYSFVLTAQDILELKTIVYLIPRGAAAEEFWCHLQEAHCYLEDPDAFLFWHDVFLDRNSSNKA